LAWIDANGNQQNDNWSRINIDYRCKETDRGSRTIRASRVFALFVLLLLLSNVARWVDEKKTDEYDRCNDNRHPKNKEEEEEIVWVEKWAAEQHGNISIIDRF